MNWPSLRSEAPILRQNTEYVRSPMSCYVVSPILKGEVEVASRFAHVKMWLLRVADVVTGRAGRNLASPRLVQPILSQIGELRLQMNEPMVCIFLCGLKCVASSQAR